MRILAKTVSIVFHPLLGLTWMLALMLLINPYLFGMRALTDPGALRLLLVVGMTTFFIPAFACWLMVKLDMIKSMEMETRTERVGPFLVTAVLYIWMYLNFSRGGPFPEPYAAFALGAIIALFVAFLINLFQKISLHATGMGGILGMMTISMMALSYPTFALPEAWGGAEIVIYLPWLLLILIAGLVGTARLYLGVHTLPEVIMGYFVGFFTQFIGVMMVWG